MKVVGTVLKVGALVAGIALAIPSGGTSLLAATLGVSGTAAAAIAGGLAFGSSLLSGSKSVPQSATQLGRLQARLDTQAARKIVFGNPTAIPVDIRYYEGSGTDDEYIDYIAVVAAHKVGSIDKIWFEDQLAWTSSGGVQGDYVGYLTSVTTRLEGTAANTVSINGGTRWGTSCRLTGCAYIHLRIKRTGNSDDEQSPLANGLPGRVTIIGSGMPCYDPRFDSTAGGSGTQRIDDQSTWGASSDNPIIQSLNALIGWRINGKLSVGGGLPAKYLDLGSVITAANICDEDIALSGGGTQKRYRTAGAFSTKDAPMAIVASLLSGCAGDLLDSEGKLSFLIKTNTLATPAVTFDDNDLVSGGSWDPMGGQTNLPNIISGTFTDPSDNSLYQPAPYPSVSLDSEDGFDRPLPLDFAVVENAARAERLAKQTLQRKQYPGTFTAEYNMKGMAAKVGTIVWQTYSPRGWVDKPFRVVSQKPSKTGRIALILREENAAIYAWSAEDTAAVQAATPVAFDPKNTGPILLARLAGKTAEWPNIADPEGTKPADNATYNTGALADLDDITLSYVTDAGEFAALDAVALTDDKITGTLPTTKADAGLKNDSITVAAGKLAGIGTADVYVDNSVIAIDVDGKLDTGAAVLPTPVANTLVKLVKTGTAFALDGGGTGDTVTLTDLGAGALAFKTQIATADIPDGELNLGGSKFTGVLPSTKAADGLKNANIALVKSGSDFSLSGAGATETINLSGLGAGALAAKSSVDLASGDVTNKTADNIAETGSKKWAGQTGADITASNQHSLSDVSSVVVNADYTGTVNSGELPKVRSVRRYVGTTDVSEDTTYEIEAISGCAATVNNTPASEQRGDVSVSAVSAAQGSIIVSAAYGGVTLYKEIPTQLLLAPPPSGGSGGSGGPPASTSSLTNPGTNTTHQVMTGNLAVTVGPSGEVDLTAPLTYYADLATEFDETQLASKWQYSADGTSGWSDVSTEIGGIVARRWYQTTIPKGQQDFPGSVSVTQTKAGLTNGATAYFRLVGRMVSGGVGIASVNGIATATPQ